MRFGSPVWFAGLFAGAISRLRSARLAGACFALALRLALLLAEAVQEQGGALCGNAYRAQVDGFRWRVVAIAK